MEIGLVILVGGLLGFLVEGLWGPKIRTRRQAERRRKAKAPKVEAVPAIALHSVESCPLRRLDPKHYREDGTCRCHSTLQDPLLGRNEG